MASATASDPRALAREHSGDRHGSTEEVGFSPRDAAVADAQGSKLWSLWPRAATDAPLAPVPIKTLDRRTSVLRPLGYEPLFYAGPVPWRRQVPAGQRVHVYLDVSGSMDGVKNALYGAILDSQAYVHPTVHLFSTEVADISLSELHAGVCKSTGGTDIACVAAHMEANRVRRSLIVTDGWVGKPCGHHLYILSSAKLAVAFLGSATNTQDLAEVADFTAPLTIGA